MVDERIDNARLESMHQLTETDFKYYLDGPASIWLLKNNSVVPPKGAFLLFPEKLIEEGHEVEAFAIQLFTNGSDLTAYGSPSETAQTLTGRHNVYFQPLFRTSKEIVARTDLLVRLKDST